jgi:hypothetical protein
LYFPKNTETEKSKEPSRFGFFEWLKWKAERKKYEEEDKKLEACAYYDVLAKMFPSLIPLKKFANGVRENIEEPREQRGKERVTTFI